MKISEVTMTQQYEMFPDLINLFSEIPDESIVSRTFYEDERQKYILFGFAPGQELSEHTASQPAVLHFLQGNATLLLGTDEHKANSGTWVHIDANLSHSVIAETEVLLLLILYKA